MRIAVDAMCAEYGGIRTYVEHLLGGWRAAHPEDEVHVALRAGSTLPTPGLVRHELRVRRPDVVGRPWTQATAMHRLVRRTAPDVVLATAPTTDPRRLPAPLVVVILDLRSEILPEQFSPGRRLLRSVSYGRSYGLAQGFLSISQRSLDDLHRLHPGTRRRPGTVAHLGGDHVHAWPSGVDAGQGPAIAFAHHSNKNPTLVVEAWAELRRRGAPVPALRFLGVSGTVRADLTAAIRAHGLDDRVTLAPFLPDAEFRQAFADASMIVFPSDFEGFGLPVVEGMTLGKPVVISPDPGLLEVAGGHASVAVSWTPGALADAVQDAQRRTAARLDAARGWAETFTWARCIEVTRQALADVTAERSPAGDRR